MSEKEHTITFKLSASEATVMLRLLRRLLAADVERTLGSKTDAVSFRAASDKVRMALRGDRRGGLR
jgi:hypothetical protein